MIMEEIRAILKMYGLAVNYRHISCLADVMTSRGKLMSITRHGVNRSDKGPLMRSSFEETVDILMDAAAFGVADDMSGVTQAVMLGQTAPVGTGFFDLFLDEAALDKVQPSIRNAQLPFGTDFSGGESPFNKTAGNAGITPMYSQTPSYAGGVSPAGGGWHGSPMQSPGGSSSSPAWSRASPAPSSPSYGAFSPAQSGFSPASPGFSPVSPQYGASPSSPAYSPSSPGYSPSSPAYGASPASPRYGASPARFVSSFFVLCWPTILFVPPQSCVQPHESGVASLRREPSESGLLTDKPNIWRVALQSRLLAEQPDLQSVEPHVQSVEPHIQSLEPDLFSLLADLFSLLAHLLAFEPHVQSLVADVQSLEPSVQPDFAGKRGSFPSIPQIQSMRDGRGKKRILKYKT